jgi:hypothetical protein
MSYTINIDHENRVVRYKYPGLLEKKDLGKAWIEILKIDEFLNQGYGLLSDYREAKFNFVYEDTEEIWDFLIVNKNTLKNKCEAILTDNPENLVMTLLFEEEVSQKIGFHIKSFSTETAALEWLKIRKLRKQANE